MLKKAIFVSIGISALSHSMVWAEDAADSDKGKKAFETYCGACHSLMLPQSQRLDRGNWEWVVDDMVNQFGCGIGKEDQVLVIDYLVKNFGPDSK